MLKNLKLPSINTMLNILNVSYEYIQYYGKVKTSKTSWIFEIKLLNAVPHNLMMLISD